jgi:O-acetyl-ADP-ribose deacetylase (regulator of RNase III)
VVLLNKETAAMIELKSGDIIHDNSEALVNSVNCVGIMGRGIALQFKNAFPANFKSYADACRRQEVQPGRMFVFKTGQLTNPHYIINFPTKRHWRGMSRIEDIDVGLKDLVLVIKQYEIHSIAIPPLGSGLGGLDWSEVKEHLMQALQSLEGVKIFLYEPQGAPSTEKMAHVRNVPSMTKGRAALVDLMARYLDGLLDPCVTLLEVHKLMYLMQEVGEPLNLHYSKGTYGPYAVNLRHVLNAIEGYMVSGYADGGDAPEKQLKLVPGAIEEATSYLRQYPDTEARIKKVADLVEGYESPFGLELLSTVHWIIKKESADSLNKIVQHTYAWNNHKRRFTPRQIALAANTIAEAGLVNRVD